MSEKGKRNIVYVLIVVGIIILLTVFHFECRICRQTKIDIPHKINVFGIEYKVCSKCYKTVGSMFDGVSDLFKGTEAQKTDNNFLRNIILSVLFFGAVLLLLSKPFREWVKSFLGFKD